MADIVYWGNGTTTLGEYTAPKDVSSAAIAQLPGGVRVDWGGGDVDVLTGDSWTTTNIMLGGWFEILRYRQFWADCAYVSRLSLLPNISASFLAFGSSAFPPYPQIDWNASGLSSGDQNPSSQYSLGASDNAFSACGQTLFGRWTRRNGSNLRRPEGQPNGFSQSFIYEVRHRRTILSSSGQSSTRIVATNSSAPNISAIPSGCKIDILYTDNSTQQLNIGICPEWVRVRDDQECPDGTCRVECPDHYCCYGCDGKPVRIIPK